jgi:putative SOS response-associated peptidase YedK
MTGSLYAFAGIWGCWRNPKAIETCSIITTTSILISV